MLNFNQLSNFNKANQRIWLYQFASKLNTHQLSDIEESLKHFAENWNSHGQSLNAKTTILASHYLLISVDENTFEASGCSIDKCTHFLKEVNETYNLDLFNRLMIGIYKNESLLFFTKTELQEALANGVISSEDFFIDLSISKGQDLDHILKPVHQAWFYPSIHHA